tara:strand:+ start:329 stop:1606 length:1278 start_codon:yes stop_codon:yes gene_type:complete
MSIIVLDKLDDRKTAVENEIKRAGWLLTDTVCGNGMSTIEKISNSAIIVLIDAEEDIEWSSPELVNILKHVTVIGCLNENVRHLVKHYIDIPLLHDLSSKTMNDLINAVSFISYKNIFPITSNKEMLTMLRVGIKAVKSSASILITGETGTGKEVVAKFLHYNSSRYAGPFVAVNCAAIPETMIEAILFGYEKGSFTNALNSHVGKFEKADLGTIFLDEIGEMTPELQSRLLRVLQNKEIERIGGRDTIKINVKVIAATNKDLVEQVQKGLFRADLFYRLNVISLQCTPLRERKEDIADLAKYFTSIYSQELESSCELTEKAIKKLEGYAWPGNVRELQNIIHKAVIICEDARISSDDIDINVNLTIADNTDKPSSLRANEAENIFKVLKETKGCRNDAAKKLMISPRTLRYKISKLKEIGFDVP